MSEKLYRDFNSYLRQIYGGRVQKITLDAGLTCPNRDGTVGRGGCIYCNQRGSGTGAAQKGQTLAFQIQEAKRALKRKYKAEKFLAYFQSFSNTYAPLDVLQNLYTDALRDPEIAGLCIGTRPDCISEPLLEYLGRLCGQYLIWMEYGLQSAHNKTLERINRGHNVNQFIQAVKAARDKGISVCAHVILGLPGESREDMLETAGFLSRLDIQAVKIHLLYIVRGTVLEHLYRSGHYLPLPRQEYVSLVGEFLSLLPKNMIIQRLTGDPHPQELIAPQWALQKQKNIEAIHDYMHAKGLYQGKFSCRNR